MLLRKGVTIVSCIVALHELKVHEDVQQLQLGIINENNC